MSIHQMMAIGLQAPEFLITPEQARVVAEAAARVGSHYDLTAGQSSLDWANLAMVVGGLYGPRVMALAARKKRERSGQVHPAG